MSASTSPNPARKGFWAIAFELLGSMYFAITLLVAVAVASVIGTVLLQKQAFSEYRIRFGDFWFGVFRELGLFDVYSAGWFLFILAFLVISTSVCVYRNAPLMLREMRNYRLHAQEKSLRAFHHRQDLVSPHGREETERRILDFLKGAGYRGRRHAQDDYVLVSAMKGAINRAGYLFTHVAIVVICIGGLIDGNFMLKWKVMNGQVKVLQEDMRADQVPAESRLRTGDSHAFRGNRTIPEGAAINSIVLDYEDGYVLQELPFTIEVKDFRVEYYSTGQPKSFESDLLIHDPALPQPLQQTIAVNHPLVYKGYAVYQASFGDGGSRLQMRAHPLWENAGPQTLQGEVNGDFIPVRILEEPLRIELTDFRLFNIFPNEEETGERKFSNWGPSFTYRLRVATGEANEYINYMQPVERDGRLFFITGVRKNPGDEFRYLRIPADSNNSLQRFLKLHAFLHKPELRREVARISAARTVASMPAPDPGLQKRLAGSLQQMLEDFVGGGLDAVLGRMEASMTEEQLRKSGATYINALRNIVGQVYLRLLAEEGEDTQDGLRRASDAQFFEDAFEALSVIPNYESPWYLELTSFEQVEASGLQITRAPGKNLVYLGCVLLIAGVFLLFYVQHKRLFFHLRAHAAGTAVLFAGSGSRKTRDYDEEFQRLAQALDAWLRRDSSPR